MNNTIQNTSFGWRQLCWHEWYRSFNLVFFQRRPYGCPKKVHIPHAATRNDPMSGRRRQRQLFCARDYYRFYVLAQPTPRVMQVCLIKSTINAVTLYYGANRIYLSWIGQRRKIIHLLPGERLIWSTATLDNNLMHSPHILRGPARVFGGKTGRKWATIHLEAWPMQKWKAADGLICT